MFLGFASHWNNVLKFQFKQQQQWGPGENNLIVLFHGYVLQTILSDRLLYP